MWSFLYDRFTVNGQPLKPYCLIKCLKILVQIWSFQNIRASPQFSCYVEFGSYMCVLQLLLSSCVLSYPAWQKSKNLNGVVEKLWTGFAHATCTHVIIAFLGSCDFLRFRKGIKLLTSWRPLCSSPGSVPFGTLNDYFSIMHFSPFAFTKTKSQELQPKTTGWVSSCIDIIK